MTLAPEVDLQETDPHYSDQIPDPTSHEVPALLGSTEGNVPDETTANELLESLLELPDTELDPADIPPLEDLTTADIDHSSPSDTVTTASVSSFASPPANEERSVRFDLSSSYDPSTSLQAMVPSHTSIFLPGIDEDDLAFPLSSPSSTPRHQSRFLQNPISPSSTIKGLASPYFASSHPDQNHHAMHDSLYGSPSRHTAFDIDLMPEFAFDNLISA